MGFFKNGAGTIWPLIVVLAAAVLVVMVSPSMAAAAIFLVFLSTVIAAFIALRASGRLHEPEPILVDTTTQKRSAVVTGNGFGFAVVDQTGAVSKFYAHPYRFERPSESFKMEGQQTTNFLTRMTWTGEKPLETSTTVAYSNQSHVIVVNNALGDQCFFMSFDMGRNALITVRRPSGDQAGIFLRPVWKHPVEKEEVVQAYGKFVRVVSFQDISEKVALVSLDKGTVKSDSSTALPGNSWALVVIDSDAELQNAVNDVLRWQRATLAEELPEREVSSHDEWRVPPRAGFASTNERTLWRHSETVLRMSQIREPNTASRFSYGMLLASLPDGEFFIPFVRDMAYGIVALIRMGHLDEARKALLSYFNARPTGRFRNETRGVNYQISVVRYFGDGSEEADFSGMSTPNVELDNWGLVLWAVGEYIRATKDTQWLSTPTFRGTVYESMKEWIVGPLLHNLIPYGAGQIVCADSTMWEEHQENKRSHVFTTVTAIAGLRGFAAMARIMHDEGTAKQISDKVKQLQDGFASAFVRNNVLRGTVETSFKNEIDGGVLEAFNMFIVTDRGIIDRTLQKLELLKTASGGYRRVRGDTNYEKQEFLFINFMLIRLIYRLGRDAEATRMLARMVDKACADNGMIPEMYVSEKNDEFVGEIGDPTGAIPMVGYGAGVYVITVTERRGGW